MPTKIRPLSWTLLACASLAASGVAMGAATRSYPLPAQGEHLVGGATRSPVLPADSLALIAFRYGLGFREVIQANPGMNPWQPGLGGTVLLPTAVLLPEGPREGIVVNVSEMRLYYYPKGAQEVRVYPIAVGRTDWPTTLGATRVRAKVKDPVWTPPESIRAEHALLGDPLPREVPPGPDNPLGNYALRLGWADILIHGTNKPLGGIGMPVTHGCVRMYPDDIETMYEQVPVGTAVRFVDQRYKLGLHRGRWFLEAHPPLDENGKVDETGLVAALTRLRDQAGADTGIDWDIVISVLREAAGYPRPVSAEPVIPLRLPPVRGEISVSSTAKERKREKAAPETQPQNVETPAAVAPAASPSFRLRLDDSFKAPPPAQAQPAAEAESQ